MRGVGIASRRDRLVQVDDERSCAVRPKDLAESSKARVKPRQEKVDVRDSHYEKRVRDSCFATDHERLVSFGQSSVPSALGTSVFVAQKANAASRVLQ